MTEPSEEADFLVGTNQDDIILGLGGNDTLRGWHGDDTLDGGDGFDFASYFGTTSGGVQVDLINGIATGVWGTDTLISIENVKGTKNSDLIIGNDVDNWILGDGGEDTIYAGGGNDYISGSDGSLLHGDLGNDIIGYHGFLTRAIGGLGDDIYDGQLGTVTGTFIEYSAGDGIDTIQRTKNSPILKLVDIESSNVAFGHLTKDTTEVSYLQNVLQYSTHVDVEIFVVGILSTGEWIEAYDPWQNIPGSAQTLSEIQTADGTISVPATSNTIPSAILGTDSLVTLAGSSGQDLILGGRLGDSTLSGGGGNDTLAGGSGADLLDGGTGADIMWGGSGNDTYVVDNAGDEVHEEKYVKEANATATAYVNGDGNTVENGGVDLVQSHVQSYTLTANVENLVLLGSAQTGNGNWLDNYLTGNGLANTLAGGQGNDTLEGLAGNDILWGGVGDDKLVGGTGNDVLNGEGGNDTLWGSNGADQMNGGAGDDWYRVDSSSDTVIEAVDGGADTVESYITYTLGANVEHLILMGSSALNGDGNGSANSIMGNSGANVLKGMDGDDTIDGAGGNDLLYGDAGNDVLDGGDGNDTLFGGGGSDTLTGGAGADTFAFRSGYGNDRIADFNLTSDNLDLRYLGIADYAALNVYNSGANVVIGMGAHSIIIENHTKAELDANHSSWLFGP